MTDFEIVEYSEELMPDVLELTRTTLGAGGAVAKTDEYWLWKHHENPFGASYGICALDPERGQIAALRILLRWAFRNADGNTVSAVRAVDTATHSNYQRQGLFSRLTLASIEELRDNGVGLIYNTPNEKSLPGYLKMGWTLVDRLPMYMKPLRPMRMIGRRLGIASQPQPATAETSSEFFDADVFVPWHTFVERHGEQLWALVAQWEKNRKQRGWRTVRTPQYLTWRFGENPNVDYFVHALPSELHDGDALEAVAILRPNVRRGWQEVVVSDIVLAEPDIELGVRLLKSVARHVRTDYLIAHFSPGTLEYECIRRSGFRRIPRQGMHFTVNPLDEKYRACTSSDSWDLCLGDLELF